MHELSIALSMVGMASKEAARRGGSRVRAVHLRLGPLSGVVRESLLFSYDAACEGTMLEGSRLVVEEVPVVVFCAACRSDTALASLQDFRCAACGEPAGEVVSGRELELVALEIE